MPRIYSETRGWPHLVQLVAQTAISLLLSSQSRILNDQLLEEAFDRAVEYGHITLFELMRKETSLTGEWEYLEAFCNEKIQDPPSDPSIATSLRRRRLVEANEEGAWELRVPLMARWLRKTCSQVA